jgi:glycosyltransferase involved in cell wall biosynthesis
MEQVSRGTGATMKVGVFIPTWNVHEHVVGVLQQVPVLFGQRCAEVFVLDNASDDGTTATVARALRGGWPFPVNVYRNQTNLGYGGTQKVAYAHALRHGYDAVAMLHGDGQYPPAQVPVLLDALHRRGAGMAYGTRFLNAEKDQTPFVRRCGVWALSMLQNLASGLRLAEWYSGFRVFRCSALRAVPFAACDNNYYFDVQIILLLSMAGYTIAELPVAKKYDDTIKSSFNISQFGRKVLAHLMHYPLARLGVLSSRLYDTRHWEDLRRTPVPSPIPVFRCPGARTRPRTGAA